MQQITFSFDSSDHHDPSEFIESSSNHLALKTLIACPPEAWGVAPYAKTLILRGPKSSGKSYLAKKWSLNSGALFLKKAHQLTESLLAHHTTFVIDGFDSSWNEEKVLHQFNSIHESNKYLLITTTQIPKLILPDLASRIKATNIVDIDFPDDTLISMLIFKLFSNFSVVVDKEVINYLVTILPREFPEIIIAVQKINDYAIEHKRKITVPLVKLALNT